jgi:hypothetical protein
MDLNLIEKVSTTKQSDSFSSTKMFAEKLKDKRNVEFSRSNSDNIPTHHD